MGEGLKQRSAITPAILGLALAMTLALGPAWPAIAATQSGVPGQPPSIRAVVTVYGASPPC